VTLNITHILKPFSNGIFRTIMQYFNRHSASRGPFSIAELLICKPITKDPTSHQTRCYITWEILMSENKHRRIVINYKLQGSVAIRLRCGGILNFKPVLCYKFNAGFIEKMSFFG